MQLFEIEDRVEERILAHERKTKRRSFYDDYEHDCVELWDAIEALQEKMMKLVKENQRYKAVVKVLMLKNGIIYKEAAT